MPSDRTGLPRDAAPENHAPIVVGLGASAGGLKALHGFFGAVPADSGIAYVVILHLDPDRQSQIAELLQARSSIPVMQVNAAVRVEADHAYIIPPGHDLSFENGTIQVMDRGERRKHAPVDLFFRTLARAHGRDAIAIVLSGTGADGTRGVRWVKEGGGITLAQSPEEAEYDGMPRSAIATGQVDLVLSASAMPAELLRLQRAPARYLPDSDKVGKDAAAAPLVKQILASVRARTGHDFGGYKPATVMRRLERRLRFNDVDSLTDYVAVLRDRPDEGDALFRELLISVSGFLRDREPFEALERLVVPKLFDGKTEDEPVRVWVAGCATGEEAYSVAMLLQEHADRLDTPPEIQLFASDVDEQAISFAREALYTGDIATDVTAERLQRFFMKEPGGYRVKKSLREIVLFALHDLLRHPPFSRLDLLCCRNLMIYLQPEAQSLALDAFHYALRPGGHLFLGASEFIGQRPHLFVPVDAKQRIYRRAVLSEKIVPRLSASRAVPAPGLPVRRAEGDQRPSGFSYGALHMRMLEAYAPPSLVVDERCDVVHLSNGAGHFLRPAGGEPSRNLLDLVHGDLRLELRTALFQAFHKQQPACRSVSIEIGDAPRRVDVRVVPLAESGETPPFALVIFEESVASGDGAAADLPARATNNDVADLDEELRRVKEQLEVTIQEREATIEQLQSTNEELQSINEEQQATTEELETSREELQSVNEELTTINQEHRSKIEELAETNADLQNLMESTSIATVFLDRRMRIRRFTPSSTALFNFVPADLGRPLAHVTHLLEYEGLIEDAERVLASLDRIEREVRASDGEWYIVRISPYRSLDDRIDGAVVTLFSITERKRAEDLVFEANRAVDAERARLSTLMEHMQSAILIAEAPSGRIMSFNQRAREIWEDDPPLAPSIDEYSTGYSGFRANGDAYKPSEWPLARSVREGVMVLDEEIEFEFAGGRRRRLLVSSAPVRDPEHRVVAAIASMVDITDRKTMEDELRAAKAAAEGANSVKGNFLATISHEFRTPLNAIVGYADILLLDPKRDEEEKRRIERIRSVAWHMAAMMDELLTFSRLEAGRESIRWERADARWIARDAAAIIETNALEKRLDLRVDLPDRALPFDCDPVKATQILINLLGNAIKYTPKGTVHLSLRTAGEQVVFEVSDTGIGISPDDQERIFDEFWQANPTSSAAYNGVGLGLAVARRFTRMLGGEITVRSGTGLGSSFTVSLPQRRPGHAAGDHGL